MIAKGLNPILNVTSVVESFAWVEKIGWRKGFDWGSPPTFGSVCSGPRDAGRLPAPRRPLGRGSRLSEAAELIHKNVGPDGGDADVPTTILVDRRGTVRWLYRSPSVIARLSPDEVLRAMDEHFR